MPSVAPVEPQNGVGQTNEGNRGPMAPGDGNIIFVLIVPDIQRYHAVFGMVKLETSHVVMFVHASWGGCWGLEPRVVPCFHAANPDDIMNRYVHYYRTCLQ